MKKICFFTFLIFLFAIAFVSAICEEGQIDINTASSIELDKLVGVGNYTAWKIINARPFVSIEELIKVYGIAEKKLASIKTQGLACMGNEQINNPVEEPKENNPGPEEIIPEKIETKKEPIKRESEVIQLNPSESQIIKSEDYNQRLSKETYATYGLVVFCFVLGGLFVVKKNKIRKNEFR